MVDPIVACRKVPDVATKSMPDTWQLAPPYVCGNASIPVASPAPAMHVEEPHEPPRGGFEYCRIGTSPGGSIPAHEAALDVVGAAAVERAASSAPRSSGAG